MKRGDRILPMVKSARAIACWASAVAIVAPMWAQEPVEVKVPAVAIYPWTYAENERGTSATAVDTAKSTLRKLFEEGAGCEVISDAKCKAAWKQVGFREVPETVEDLGQLPLLGDPKDLLAFGERLGADYVCSGTLGWTVRSIWVGLGPKTKAYANVNVIVIDVKKKEIALEVRDFRSDSTKAEKWYETAGALLVSWGITLFSGGPKTPHMQNAAVKGIGGAIDPFIVSMRKKIG